MPTPIILQPLANDGVTLQGSATTIFDNNGAADQGIVEAPALVKSGSTFVLFFSKGQALFLNLALRQTRDTDVRMRL